MKKEQFTDKLLAANGLIREERLGKPQLVLILVASLLVLLSPMLLSSYRLNLVVSILSAAYLAQCWSLMSGFAGQFSFGHAAFYGLGAYTSSMLYTDFGITPWVGMLFGMLVAGLVAALIGVLSFRYKLRGDYFALATLAFAEMLRIIFNNTEFLHAAQGVMITYKKDWRVMQFGGKDGYSTWPSSCWPSSPSPSTGCAGARPASASWPSVKTRTPPRPWASTPSATRCWRWW